MFGVQPQACAMAAHGCLSPLCIMLPPVSFAVTVAFQYMCIERQPVGIDRECSHKSGITVVLSHMQSAIS